MARTSFARSRQCWGSFIMDADIRSPRHAATALCWARGLSRLQYAHNTADLPKALGNSGRHHELGRQRLGELSVRRMGALKATAARARIPAARGGAVSGVGRMPRRRL